jgi:hypothetical protein
MSLKMADEPKIFVGTMWSGEAEFETCCAAITAQQGVNISHHVISNLPELEAHNELWSSWNRAKSFFDLFVKVDSDTIISDPYKFRAIWETFKSNKRITGIQIPLHDYFTQKSIAGLNCFSPKVIFNMTTDKLYCDRVDTGHDLSLKGAAVDHLSPGGLHCAFPNKKQAFHFGLHRAMKNQRDKIKDTYLAWVHHKDDARAWALIGAMYAQTDLKNSFNYTDNQFNDVIDNLVLDAEIIEEMIRFCEEI